MFVIDMATTVMAFALLLKKDIAVKNIVEHRGMVTMVPSQTVWIATISL